MAAYDPTKEIRDDILSTEVVLSHCPIPMHVLGPRLDALVEKCSAHDEAPTICDTCFHPVKAAMADVFHEEVDQRFISNLSHSDEQQMRDACGRDTINYLHSKGMPLDEFFYVSVAACADYQDFEGDDKCPIPQDDFHAFLDSNIRTACQKVSDDLAEDDDNATASKFCATVYWPTLGYILNNGMPETFWCKFKQLDAQLVMQMKSMAADVDAINGEIQSIMAKQGDEMGNNDDVPDSNTDNANATTNSKWHARFELQGQLQKLQQKVEEYHTNMSGLKEIIEDILFHDPGFMSCIQNSRTHLMFEGDFKCNPAKVSRIDHIHEKCWDTENLPAPGTLISDATREKMSSASL
eukprot:gene12248-14461_t